MREFESTFSKVLKYGLVTIPFGLIGFACLYIYRTYTDKCRKNCNRDQQCFNKCYLQASEKVVKQIRMDLSRLNKIEDEKKRKSTEKTLRKELKKWEEKVKEYKSRLII